VPEDDNDDSPQTWPRCPEAAAFFHERLDAFARANPRVAEMAARFREVAGVSLASLVDHWTLPESAALCERLRAIGLTETATEDGDPVWEHPQARLPRVRLLRNLAAPRLALAVEDVGRFVAANGLTVSVREGDLDSGYQEARCLLPGGDELAVVVRAGYRGFRPRCLDGAAARRLAGARAAFRDRDRCSGEEADVLARTQALVEGVIGEIGRDRATDEFFAAERDYWMARNRAARWQFERQQEVGIGWANHDHHTYRSSRASFVALTRLWRTFGFLARERFYAGQEAGWGAQILEHAISRVVIFADVDLAADELDVDFAGTVLPPRDALGTIGLWCALHGSSIAGAGMHHLEAEFDWERARALLEAAGFGVMAPFTDLPMLKQAFTVAEVWPVSPDRVRALQERGWITAEQAEGFLRNGAPGSHLEVLQRWDGFKGFNKTGVSAILRETDARRATAHQDAGPHPGKTDFL